MSACLLDSPVVANIRKAGGVIIGRTNTPAFSHRWFTDNGLHGASHNKKLVTFEKTMF